MKPNNVYEQFATKEPKITVKLDKEIIFFEGDAVGLEFLANLFLVAARTNEISPTRAEHLLFSGTSFHRLYIQRQEFLTPLKRPTIATLLAELHQIEAIELEIPARVDRVNPLLESDYEFSL